MDDFNFVETDSAKLYTEIIGSLMDSCNEALYPGDERRIFGEGLVAVFVSIFNLFNDKAQQRTLRYARGKVLDAIGERIGVNRMPQAFASAVFRFSLADALTQNIIIPSGTRITTDGTVYFATQETAVLSAGDTYIDLLGVCTEGGTIHNGYGAGTIATLVDLIPYISQVANITISTGGDDGEPYTDDGDDRYRERIRLSYSAKSTAGPEGAYRYFVMTADSDIIDVAVVCPEDQPNVVNLYPLMAGGELPDADVLEKVLAVLADDVRPMTDKVNAFAPEAVDFEIEIKYYCTKDNEAATIETIEGNGGAIEQYREWQTAALGRDIIPDQLRRFILAPATGTGALRVDIIKPSLIELSKAQVARFTGTATITHEVVAG